MHLYATVFFTAFTVPKICDLVFFTVRVYKSFKKRITWDNEGIL